MNLTHFFERILVRSNQTHDVHGRQISLKRIQSMQTNNLTLVRFGIALALVTFLVTGWSAAKVLLALAQGMPLTQFAYLPLPVKLALVKLILQLTVSVAGVAITVLWRSSTGLRWIRASVCLLLAVRVIEWAVQCLAAAGVDSSHPGELVNHIRKAVFTVWHIGVLAALTPGAFGTRTRGKRGHVGKKGSGKRGLEKGGKRGQVHFSDESVRVLGLPLGRTPADRCVSASICVRNLPQKKGAGSFFRYRGPPRDELRK